LSEVKMIMILKLMNKQTPRYILLLETPPVFQLLRNFRKCYRSRKLITLLRACHRFLV
jgi:hypothetical protein